MQAVSPNRITADIVDEAVAESDTAGRRRAAAVMDGHGVPFAVIVRVLSPDGPRRGESRSQGPFSSSSSLNERAGLTTSDDACL
jgi:hypothetical protein